MSNNTTIVTKMPADMVWMVDYSAPMIETESHDAVKLAARDRDGRYAPQERPISKRKAINKLCKNSQRTSKAIDAMMDMEDWR